MAKSLFRHAFIAALLLTCNAAAWAQQRGEQPDNAVLSPALAPTPAPAPPASLLDQAVDKAGELVLGAMGQLGIRYKRGGTTPERGFDCSGFVQHVYRNTVGLLLPRTSAEMAHEGTKVSKSELQPGDLVFFNTLRRTYSHVGIYIGDGKFVHAPSTGGVVRVESMNVPYWQRRYNGARRVEALYDSGPTTQATQAAPPAATAAPVVLTEPAAARPVRATAPPDPLDAAINRLK
ncbi:MAG: C40 family peptidase [Betaproteobacteria bacterium]|nr:C40 family peptidase [Betaproteobacteria bacterium]